MTILIYFNSFTDVIGGSEYLPLTLIHEFQQRGDRVTLAVHHASDLKRARLQYGIPIDLTTLCVKCLDPESRFEWWVNRLFRCLFALKLQRLARHFDLCISTANPVDFGRPAIHFIYMLGLTDAHRRALGWVIAPCGLDTLSHRLWRRFSAWLADKFIVHVRPADEIMRDSRERIYPNSNWARCQIELFFGCSIGPTFYPPTLSEPMRREPMVRQDMVVSIGRIDRLKRIEVQISILEKVRAKTGRDLRFVIAGHVNDDDYGWMIRHLVSERPWIMLAGAVYGDEKTALLSSAKFALHATTCEAFGISVVEYLKYGILPVVPNTGGAAEIVEDPNLQYGDIGDAVTKLSRLILDNKQYELALSGCCVRAKMFSASSYWQRQKELVGSWTDLHKGA